MKSITSKIEPYKSNFPDHLSDYIDQIDEAITQNKHHDHRRNIFLNFLRLGFDVDPIEVLLEEKIKVAQVRGRIDALFKTAIFEFKVDLRNERPAGLFEIKKYFESRNVPSNYLAILTDGKEFELYQYEKGEPNLIGKFELSKDNPLEAYINLDQILFSAKKATPRSVDITTRFGPNSAVFNKCRGHLEQLYSKVKGHTSVKVKIKEWNTLLSRVYGEGLGDEGLFIRHTYLTIFSRLLVVKALYPKEKRKVMDYRGLLSGDYFNKKNLSNVVESDFFGWALTTTVEKDFIGVIGKLEAYLDVYDLSNITEDILKEIYQELVDPASRHSLGEYYTPDWIADKTFERIGYSTGVVLDPACGSGSFLLAAIRKLKNNGIKGKKLVETALDSVVGIDVHPLAVIMTKANILLALADGIKTYTKNIYLPVYMADTLLLTEDAKMKTIIIEATNDESFHIPLKSIETMRDMDQFLDELSIVAEQAATGQELHTSAMEGLKKTLFKNLANDEQHFWRQNFNLLTKLIKSKRNSVWKFILKNAYKPAYLRNNKVDYIVGNPPWLSYRYIKDDNYKSRVKKLTFEMGLLGKTEVKLFTQMDTSTLFFAYCQKHFLKKGGTIAFVLPKTTILPAKQHLKFQMQGVSEIHDFSDVSPLFNVRSVLLIRKTDKFLCEKIPTIFYSGQLPKKNMEWKEASFHINLTKGTWDFLDSAIQSQHYYERFFQGATIVPRCFWFVQPDKNAASNKDAPFLETSDEAYDEAKEAWRMRLMAV
jgi:methylase of polypeptide subunit release factors